MIQPGEVVTLEFPGARVTKRRPAVVLSSVLYHQSRPDVIVGIVTSRLDAATGPTDYVLKDWSLAGLRRPSAFRVFLATLPAASVTRIGRLSDRDWREVRERVRLALSCS